MKEKTQNFNDKIGFLQIDARLTLATGFKHKESEKVIPFDGVDFKLVAFMIQRENYFKNVKHSLYFESLDRICTAVTGKPHTDHGGNKDRIKKLREIGLLKVATTKKNRVQNKGKKSICKLDDVLKHYDLVNDALFFFDTPEAVEQRHEAKTERLEVQKQREEDRKQPLHGDESYLTDHPPVEMYETEQPLPDGYHDNNEANYNFVDDINLDNCPTYSICDDELASFEQRCVDKGEDNNFGFVSDINIDEYPQIEVSDELFSTKEQPTTDKTILESYIDHGVIDDIPPSFGIGWFAAPLSKNELDRYNTVKYLSILHKRGLWDEYNPDQQLVDAIYNVLVSVEPEQPEESMCVYCDHQMERGHCTNPHCQEIPF